MRYTEPFECLWGGARPGHADGEGFLASLAPDGPSEESDGPLASLHEYPWCPSCIPLSRAA